MAVRKSFANGVLKYQLTGGALSDVLKELNCGIAILICGKELSAIIILAGTSIAAEPENSGNINCKAVQ
ncbi:MAG: hypothetical protein ABJA35_07860 [Parafilimonas sp.]